MMTTKKGALREQGKGISSVPNERTDATSSALSIQAAIPAPSPFELCEAGLALHPVRPGTKAGFYKGVSWPSISTLKPSLVDSWYNGITPVNDKQGQPVCVKNCGFGVHPGAADMVVIDVDVKNGARGDTSWSTLAKEHGGLDCRFIVETPSGGVHRYYRGKTGSPTGFRPGIDIKSIGGHVVAPGTVIPDYGEYKIVKGTLANLADLSELPASLCSEIGLPRKRKSVEFSVGEEMTNVQRVELKSAMDCLDPTGYDDWLHRGMEIHSAYPGRDGFELWNEWSEGSNYGGLEVCRRKWATFTHGEGGRTIASLFHEAREQNWKGQAAAVVSDEVASCLQIVDAGTYVNTSPPPPCPVLVDFIDRGDKVSLIGPAKSKKTWLGTQMAVCIAVGRSFLRWEVVQPSRVLFVQLEVKEAHFHRRVKMVCDGLEIKSCDLAGRLGVINGRGDGITTAKILQAVKCYRADIVFVDPAYKLLNGEENSAEGWKPMLRDFDRICEDCGAAVIYTLHDGKGDAGSKNSIDRGSGSGIVARDYDAALILTPHADGGELRVIETVKRNYVDEKPFSVEWELGVFSVSKIPAKVKANANSRKNLTPLTNYMEELVMIMKNSGRLSMNKSEMVEAIQVSTDLSAARAKLAVDQAVRESVLTTNYGKKLHRKQILYALSKRDLDCEIIRINRES